MMRLGLVAEISLFLVMDVCFVAMLWTLPHGPVRLTLALAGFLTGGLVAFRGSRLGLRLICGVFGALCLAMGLIGLTNLIASSD